MKNATAVGKSEREDFSQFLENMLLGKYMGFLLKASKKEIEVGQDISSFIDIELIENSFPEKDDSYGANNKFLEKDDSYGTYLPVFVGYLASGNSLSYGLEKLGLKREHLLDKADKIHKIVKDDLTQADSMLVTYAKSGEFFDGGYSFDVYKRLAALLTLTKNDPYGRILVKSVFGDEIFEMLEYVKIVNIISVLPHLDMNKKSFLAKKNEGTMNAIMSKGAFADMIDQAFQAYGHEDHSFERMLDLNSEAAEAFDSMESAFRRILMSDMSNYKAAAAKLASARDKRTRVYEDISYDIKDEINERVDGINGWSFSEYFIVNDMGLEHRANVKHADDLNEARWNVAKSKDSLDRIDVRLSKHMLNLASNAIILSSILLQNKSAFSAIKGFIGDGKENGGR